MEHLSATETAFLLVACQQIVLAAGWLAAVPLLASTRRAVLLWAGYAGLSAAALVLFVVSTQPGTGVLRAFGNVVIVAAMVCLQRGVRSFFGAPSGWRWHGVVLVAAAGTVWAAMLPQQTAWRVAVIAGLLAAICLSTARDMYRELPVRMGLDGAPRLLLAAPLVLGGLTFAARGLRAVFWPESILAEVMSNSALNVSSAYVQGLLALTQQLTLLGLVATRLVGDLRRTSRHDALTGLLNRGAMDELLATEARRAARLGEPFTVLMIDVDHFKAINDSDGHAAGDRALQHLATLLGTQMRDIDRVGRWGGEEFVVVMPATRLDEAASLAERLRGRAEAMPLRWHERELPLTLSVGVAQWHPADETHAALLLRADAALYRAKAGGRNRIERERAPAEVIDIGGAAAA